MQPHGDRLAFGPFEICPVTGELWNAGQPVRLAPQPFAVLALLVERAGSLVTREELQTTVWPDGTTVEFDQGLNYCIRQIRLALRDDAREPGYIATIPKRGYRLLVPVVTPDGRPLDVAPVPSRAGRRWAAATAMVLLTAIVLTAIVWLGPGMATTNLPTGDRARQLFLEAEQLSGTWELDKVNAAVARYEEVTRLEPRFADAWAGLTHADILLSYLGPQPVASRADSEIHARRALELDSTLSVAHAALGHSYWHQWRWREAGEQFQTAVAGRGSTAAAHQLYGLYLASLGFGEQAVRQAREAVEQVPTSGLFGHSLAQVYLQAGQFEAARSQARRTLDVDRHFPLAYRTLFRADIQLGLFEEATHVLEDESRYVPDGDDRGPWEAYLLARLGRTELARRALEGTQGHRPGGRKSLGYAAALTAMGDHDGALAAIEESLSAHVPSLIWVRVAPELAPLRSDPRFDDIVSRLHAQAQ